jgi:hypothetical protein
LANCQHLHWHAGLCGEGIACCTGNELGWRFRILSTIYVNELSLRDNILSDLRHNAFTKTKSMLAY